MTEHRKCIRFNPGERFDSFAQIAEVFAKGSHHDLMALVTALMIDPFGTVADRVRHLTDARLNLRADVHSDHDLLIAARHLLLGFSNLIVRGPLDEYTRPDAPMPDCPRCSSPLTMVRELPVGCEIRCFGVSCDWREIWPNYADWRVSRCSQREATLPDCPCYTSTGLMADVSQRLPRVDGWDEYP